MTAEAIRDMAWDVMRKGALSKIDVQHDRKESGCYVVESFIARPGPTAAWPLFRGANLNPCPGRR